MLLLMGGAFLWFGYSLISENSPTTVELKLENSTKLIEELQDKIKNARKRVESLEQGINSMTNKVCCLGCSCHAKKKGDSGQ